MADNENRSDFDAGDDSEYLYKTVMDGKRKSRIWSLTSLVAGVISIFFSIYIWVGLITGVAAIIFAIISRRNIGYFDGFAIGGLILGIVGVVFTLMAYLLIYLIANNEGFKEIYEELLGNPDITDVL